MIELESKACCPHCGETLHRKPYLMASHPDVRPPAWALAGTLVLVFLIVFGLAQLI